MPVKVFNVPAPRSLAYVVPAALIGLSSLVIAGAADASQPTKAKPTIALVAHSYGGAVITNAATGNPNVKGLVYVAPFIPDGGEVGSDLLKFPGSQIVLPDGPDATVTASPFPGGVDFYVNADRFRKIFAADLPAEETALMAADQRPLALAAFTDASGPPAWRTIPAWALVCAATYRTRTSSSSVSSSAV
jgi:pimeloyl-ACP methyl ester carboxylesterase